MGVLKLLCKYCVVNTPLIDGSGRRQIPAHQISIMHAVLGRGRAKFVYGDDSFTSMILVIQPASNTLLSTMQHSATCESCTVAMIGFLTLVPFFPEIWMVSTKFPIPYPSSLPMAFCYVLLQELILTVLLYCLPSAIYYIYQGVGI